MRARARACVCVCVCVGAAAPDLWTQWVSTHGIWKRCPSSETNPPEKLVRAQELVCVVYRAVQKRGA